MKQQQVAMKLAKGAGGRPGSERYMWWAVTSLLLQARAAAAGTCQRPCCRFVYKAASSMQANAEIGSSTRAAAALCPLRAGGS